MKLYCKKCLHGHEEGSKIFKKPTFRKGDGKIKKKTGIAKGILTVKRKDKIALT